MRPGQNKRMRGRPTNNRRGPNPLTRSYESNGPDVKIRGNAHHVAEKYLQLARDAHTGGDPVAAENYLQHAEHYFRLIAAAQAAQALAQSGQSRPPGEGERRPGRRWRFRHDVGSFRLARGATECLSSNRNKGFNRNRMRRRTRRNLMPSGRLTRASARARTIGRLLPIDRTGRATDFRNAVRDRTGRSPTGTKAIATIGTDATVVRGISGHTAILSPSRRGKLAPRASASRASLLHNRKSEAQHRGPGRGRRRPMRSLRRALRRLKPGRRGSNRRSEGSAFPPRGRRRRLRSPYGFGGAGSGETERPDTTPEITGDSPVDRIVTCRRRGQRKSGQRLA